MTAAGVAHGGDAPRRHAKRGRRGRCRGPRDRAQTAGVSAEDASTICGDDDATGGAPRLRAAVLPLDRIPSAKAVSDQTESSDRVKMLVKTSG